MKILYLNIDSLCTVKSYFSKILKYYNIPFEERHLVQDGDMPINGDIMRKLMIQQSMNRPPDKLITTIHTDKTTIKNINLLIKLTGCKLILTHPNRTRLNIHTSNILCKSLGINGIVIDNTPMHIPSNCYSGYIKGEEILTSVSTKWKCKNFVILDHDTFEVFPIFKKNLIRIDIREGFTFDKMVEASNILKVDTDYMDIILNLNDTKREFDNKLVGSGW